MGGDEGRKRDGKDYKAKVGIETDVA